MKTILLIASAIVSVYCLSLPAERGSNTKSFAIALYTYSLILSQFQ